MFKRCTWCVYKKNEKSNIIKTGGQMVNIKKCFLPPRLTVCFEYLYVALSPSDLKHQMRKVSQLAPDSPTIYTNFVTYLNITIPFLYYFRQAVPILWKLQFIVLHRWGYLHGSSDTSIHSVVAHKDKRQEKDNDLTCLDYSRFKPLTL